MGTLWTAPFCPCFVLQKHPFLKLRIFPRKNYEQILQMELFLYMSVSKSESVREESIVVPDKLGSDYYRGFLSVQGKEYYDMLFEQIQSGNYSGLSVFSNKGLFSSDDCFAAYQAIREDHPEFFFLGGKGQCIRIYEDRAEFQYPMNYTPEEIRAYQPFLSRQIEKIIKGTSELPEVERETLIYTRIAEELDYDDHDEPRDHNLVGPLDYGSGVCEGYNALLMVCFRKAGIPCISITSEMEDGTFHCWTLTWINGEPVHCDVTWESKKDGVLMYRYFNLSDREIAKSHKGQRNANIPPSNEEGLNYYRHNGLVIRSFRDLKKLMLAKKGGLLLFQFDYEPSGGDYIEEIRKALKRAQIRGRWRVVFCKDSRRTAIRAC